tara:strand:+ start:28 stop:672 length:645 start_codon:yes stop_codon:yes gene_type:complete
MGQNSTEVAYGFGQFGSAYSDIAKPIVPPTGLVITAITFLADNTPTALTPEKLDTEGPSYINIQSTSGDIQVADNHANFNGVVARDVADGTHAAGDDITIASISNKIKTGQYVLLVAAGDTDTAGITIDSETPIPITRGPNQQGVKVTSYDGDTAVTLDTQITPSTQGLIFLDDFHGAGGLTAASQVYPAGVTIYGRWTTFTPSAAGVICYFGK